MHRVHEPHWLSMAATGGCPSMRPWAGELNGSLAFALANVLLWYGVVALLYHRRIFIKV